MKLLHPEVEIAPGTPGKRPTTPTPEREKLSGSVILRLTNETAQENAYTIRLRCDHPLWQESWYTVQSWTASGSANTAPSGKADVPGHNGRSLKVFVPRGGTRDIHIRFNVPKRPESRAGRYDYAIEVETQITTPQDGAVRRKDRLTSIPAVANVRPFYAWSLDLTPEQQRVTRRRRTGEFEVVVTNEGNDWLYCDLQLPRPKDLLLDCPTLRLAVPPPEPGELLPSVGIQEGRSGTQRVVPLLATTRLKLFRGDLTPQPLLVSAVRVDAPSLAPPAEDGYLSLGSVVAAETNPREIQPAPTDRALMYAPPVPAKLIDFFTRGAGSFRAWIAPILMLAIAIPAAILVFQKVQFKQGVKPETKNLPKANTYLNISGPWVLGSKIRLIGQIGNQSVVRDLESVPPDLKSGIGVNKCRVFIPANLDHFVGTLHIERAGGIFDILPSLLAVTCDITPFQIGDKEVIANPVVDPVNPGPYAVASKLTISGQNLGYNKDHSGFVTVGDQNAHVDDWQPTSISITLPATLTASPNTLSVKVLLAGGNTLDAKGITIGSTPPPPATTKTAGSSGSSGAPGGGPKPSGSSGGSKPTGGGGGSVKPGKSAKANPPGNAGGETANGSGVSPIHTHNPSPPYPQAPSLTAEEYLLLEQYDKAISIVSAQNTAAAHAIQAIAYARKTPPDLAKAQLEAGLASGSAVPADQALALVAQGWIVYQQGNKRLANNDWKQAVSLAPSLLLVKVSDAWGDPDPHNVTTRLSNLLNQPGLTQAAKKGLSTQYNTAYKHETED